MSVSVLGEPGTDDAAPERAVRAELEEWFGPVVKEWRALRTYRVRRALPVRWPLERLRPQELRAGLWVAGDFVSTASIQGAMESGEAVAEAILREMGDSVRRVANRV